MDLIREQQIHRIFLQALDKPVGERRSFLQNVCLQDKELLQLVVQRLEGIAAIENNFQKMGLSLPSDDGDASYESDQKYVGERFGPYRLIGKLGEGGMGAVYLADRDDGEFRMRVAVKVTRRDLASQVLVRRFRRERQIMANLKHPYIATLYDGGTTKEGYPYFVMEFVDGQTITRFCKTANLNLQKRLVLFKKVCEGVAFAHDKGIIHRDLKPSNILVNQWGEPKLLDFGIARAETDPINTTMGAKMMTPAYASPEQVMGNEVDGASDIYSLGVLLYEMVTGRLPYSFDGCSGHEIARIICEEEPNRPSSCVTEESELIPSEESHTPAPEIADLTGLDEVVLKALQKEPGQRFASVSRLVDSIHFFQKGLRIPNPNDKQYDALLCYRKEDSASAGEIAKHLGTRLEMNPESITLSSEGPSQKALEKQLDITRCCLILVGRGNKPPWHHGALRNALAVRASLGSVRIVPLLLPGANRPLGETALPRFLRGLPWTTLQNSNQFQTFLDRVVPLVETEARDLSQGIAKQETCPFRGLKAFGEKDKQFFFGRQSLIQRLTLHMQQKRFLAVLGPSGSGKSSLVRAGLVPELRQRGHAIVLFTATDQPLTELAYGLQGLIPDEQVGPSSDQWFRLLGQNEHGLQDIAKKIGQKRIFIAIDQFEEVFTLAQDPTQRESFISNLLYALDQPDGPISVILTLRSDFLGHCITWPDLNNFVSEHLVQVAPMNQKELHKAVEEPARMVGLTFEEGLVSRILDDVSGAPGELPLLQHALLELYEQRDGWTLTAAAYTKIGGIEGALARRADAEYDALNEHEREILRKMVTLCLIQTVEGSDDTRRIATLEEVLAVHENGALVKALLQRWTAARLLTIRGDEARGVELIEVAHEALIRRWGKIQTWMAEDRQTTRLVNRLRQEARIWEEGGNTPDLLPRGGHLLQLSELCQKKESHLSSLEKSFVAAGCEARDREQQEREERQRKELKSAQKLVRLSWGFAAGTLAGLILLGLLAWQVSEKEREAQRLLSSSYLRESQTAWENREFALAAHLSANAVTSLPGNTSKESLLLHHHLLMENSPWSRFTLHHEGYIAGAIFNNRQDRILSWSFDKTLRLWDRQDGRPIGQVMEHKDKVWGAVFSRDDGHILSWSFDGTLQLWDATTGQRLGQTMRHGDKVWGAVFSPDGQSILSWSFDKTLRLWHGADGTPKLKPLVHQDAVIGAVFSSDNQRILSWGKDGKLRVWNSSNGTELIPAMGHKDWVWGARFNGDETRILSWSRDGTASLWDAHNGKKLISDLNHGHWVRGAAFNEDETQILSWSDDRNLRLWTTETGLPSCPPMSHDGKVIGAFFFRDGKRIISWSEDHRIRIWDPAKGRQIGPDMVHDAKVIGVTQSPNGQTFLSWSLDKTLRLWDETMGRQVGPTLSHGDVILGAAFTNDERQVLTWGYDQTIRLWVISDQRPGQLLGHQGQVMSATVSRDETRVLSSSDDHTIRIWDLETERQSGLSMEHDGKVWGAVWDRGEQRILSWGRDGTIRLWDVATQKQIETSLKHDGWVRGAVFDHQEQRILSWGNDNTARLWDLSTHQPIGPAMVHDDHVRGARFDQSQRHILSWGNDGKVRLWETASGKQIGTPLRHEDRVAGAVFGKNQQTVLSWAEDKTIRLWDLPTGKPLAPPMVHDDIVWGAVFFRDETRILSWSFDRTIRIWDPATGRQVGPTLFHDDVVVGVQLSNDEKRLFSWSRDKTIRIWDLAMGRQLGPAIRHDKPVTGIWVSDDQSRMVSWAGEEIQVRNIGTDLDLPPGFAEIQARMITGMNFDPLTRVLTPIQEQALVKIEESYLEQAAAHFLVCRYRDHNLFGKMYRQPRTMNP